MEEDDKPKMEDKHDIKPKIVSADYGHPVPSIFGPPMSDTNAMLAKQQASADRDATEQRTNTLRYPTPSSVTDCTTCSDVPIACDQALKVDRALNSHQKHGAIPLPSLIEGHGLEESSECNAQLPVEATPELDDEQEQPDFSQHIDQGHLQVDSQALPEKPETCEDPETQEDIVTNMQDQQALPREPVEPTPKKPKDRCGKNAREQAERRHKKRHDILKEHVRKQIRMLGYNLAAEDVPPPPPVKRRSPKQLGEESDDSDDFIDPDAPEPEIHEVKAKDRVKEIGRAIISGGLTNRRTGSQKDDLKDAKTTFGYKKVQAIEKGSEMLYRLRGMTVLLKPFQLVGVSWMVQRETDDGLHKGGLLADVPGFGKTVMSLGTIIGNPPSPELIEQGIKATLVVVPNVSILKQWEMEIEKHMEKANATSYHYKSSQNVLAEDRINDMNIVLVTYPEIQRGWPSAKTRAQVARQCTVYRINEDGEEIAEIDRDRYHDLLWKQTDRIFLHEMVPRHFRRGTFSKEYQQPDIRACLAAQNLQYEIFWGLSGTPLVNAAKEMFPYLKLIKWTDVETEAEYREKYLKDPDGRGRVDALVNLLTYRRTHEDRFLGKKMVALHKANACTHWVNLTAEERVVYDVLTELFNVDGAQNGAQLKLRQRQAVSHFFLLESFFRTSTGTLALESFIEKVAKVEHKKTAYEQIGSWSQREVPGAVAPEDSADFWATALEPFGKSNFGGKFRLTPLLQILLNTAILKQSKCEICQKGHFNDPRKLPDCGHIFCNYCIVKFWITQQMRRISPRCPKCNTVYQGGNWGELPRVHFVADFQPKAGPTTKDSKQKRRKKNTDVFGESPERRLGDDFFGTQPAFGDERGGLWAKVVLDNMFGNESVPIPSAKITAVKEIVLRWIKEDPSHKGIIFTQFITTNLLIGRMLQLEGIHFVYLTGKSTPAEKLKAIEGFKANPNIRYLVASMRCGGQSLNLTCANRVIMCDTWWNRAAEEQAFGRVFRLGQMKNTHNIRILARGTVDEDIETMHKIKAEAIDHTMHDDGHATQFHSDFEIMKVLEPERWIAWVQQCIDEIREEDGVMPEPMDAEDSQDQVPEEQACPAEMEDRMELAETLLDLRQGQATTDKRPFIDLETECSDEDGSGSNPYGPQDIGRNY